MKKIILFIILGFAAQAYAQYPQPGARQPVDKVGFATTAQQMDSVLARTQRSYGARIDAALAAAGIERYTQWKTAICPHDDYTYVSWLYPAVLRNVKAPTVILIGVAHKAKQFGLENRIVFGSFEKWKEPYGNVAVSYLQSKITNQLPKSVYVVHDSLMMAEHSLEALVPYLQFYNRNVNIIPILVPYMSFETMQGLAQSLAKAIYRVMQENTLMWGKDIAIVISNDAVHYGDEEWGGKNYARFGADSAGYAKAVNYEKSLIASTLVGPVKRNKIEAFCDTTVSAADYKEYRWTWCGRYAVPFGLLVTDYLSQFTHENIKGNYIGYKTSLTDPPLKVDDLKMGVTAPATLRHWVGYAGIGYK